MRFTASALPIGRKDMDMSSYRTAGNHDPKAGQVHSLELRAKAAEGVRSEGKTHINVDMKQMGLVM